MANARAHVVIEGRVQGVFFRSYARDQAESLGLKGYVRNCWNGSVEAVFEGDEGAVEAMVDWCYQGSPHSVVTDVDVAWEEYQDEFRRFSVRY